MTAATEWRVDVAVVDRARILRGWTRRELGRRARLDEGHCVICLRNGDVQRSGHCSPFVTRSRFRSRAPSTLRSSHESGSVSAE